MFEVKQLICQDPRHAPEYHGHWWGTYVTNGTVVIGCFGAWPEGRAAAEARAAQLNSGGRLRGEGPATGSAPYTGSDRR